VNRVTVRAISRRAARLLLGIAAASIVLALVGWLIEPAYFGGFGRSPEATALSAFGLVGAILGFVTMAVIAIRAERG
jgi:hypothetical protein